LAKEYNSNLLRRTITGVIIALPLIFIIIAENYWIFLSLISIFSIAGFFEWIKNSFIQPILWGFNLIFIYFWFSICLLVGLLSAPSFAIKEFYDLHELSAVSVYHIILIILLNTALFDIFAYFVGSNFGKIHISPNISPNETLEGLIGGLIGNIIFGFLVSYLLNISYWSVLICFFGGILAFYGDLLISFLKRDKSIKDTGNILPGHGGILDRIDSHLLATPIMLLFFILIVIL
jgi:phosphatidate cytidylyltransferase